MLVASGKWVVIGDKKNEWSEWSFGCGGEKGKTEAKIIANKVGEFVIAEGTDVKWKTWIESALSCWNQLNVAIGVGKVEAEELGS